MLIIRAPLSILRVKPGKLQQNEVRNTYYYYFLREESRWNSETQEDIWKGTPGRYTDKMSSKINLRYRETQLV